MNCPICNKAIFPNKSCLHQIGDYAVYYDCYANYGNIVSTSVYKRALPSEGKFLFTMKSLIKLDEKRIETILLLK